MVRLSLCNTFALFTFAQPYTAFRHDIQSTTFSSACGYPSPTTRKLPGVLILLRLSLLPGTDLGAMRLLYFNSSKRLASTDFSGKTVPPYAILSHTWDGDEFLFEDLVNDTGKTKAGYEKIQFCGEQAARDNLQYFWVDTCCIDKWNICELSNAINSMFLWYRNAAKCYVYLSDVSIPVTEAPRGWTLRKRITSVTVRVPRHQSTWEASFRKSRWFTRGWTLQELIAPASVEFFSLERRRLGDKESLEQQIHEITRIPVEALRGGPLEDFSVQDRRAWMVGRQTTQEEDLAYSLIGIFSVSMEFRYGEGKERALSRLQEEMEKGTPYTSLSNKY
jgi:hypothetical protein